MPRAFILFLFVLINISYSFAQPDRKILTYTDQDTLLLYAWSDTAYDLRTENANLSKEYALLVDSVSVLINYLNGISEARSVLGILAKNGNNPDEAIRYFESSKMLRDSLGNYKGVAACCNNLGNVERERNNFAKAEDYYEEGINVLIKNNIRNYPYLGALYNNLAMVKNKLGYSEVATQYIDSSLMMRKALNDSIGIANTLLNAGAIAQALGFLDEAVNKYKTSLNIFNRRAKLDGVLKCKINLGAVYREQGEYQEALRLFEEIEKKIDQLSSFNRFILNHNIGVVKQHLNKLDTALIYFQKASELLDTTNNQKDNAQINYDIGGVYFQKGEYKKSLTYFQNGKKKLEGINDAPVLKMNILDKLSENYAKLNQFKAAFDASYQSNRVQESLRYAHKEAVELKLDNEMLKHENETLTYQQEIQEQRIKNTKIAIGGGALATLLSFVGLFFRRRYHRERKASQQRVDEVIRAQELKVLKARLDGQDIERNRIGQDLHDRLGVMLSTIKMYFMSVEEKIENVRIENKDQFQKASELLDDACEEVRKVAQDIQSSTLTDFGLKEELKELAETLKGSQKIEVNITTFGIKDRMDNQMEFELYKIIQELVANTLKHSEASNLNIELNQFKNLINIMIEDDGKGFDVMQLKSAEGMGLKNVQARVLDLHGNIDIDSQLGRGTTFTIDIPIQQKTEI